jgi:hypoxanthine phosphoribosyltransferase
MPGMEGEGFEVLIGSDDLKKRIGELAEQISQDYRGRNLLLVGVLRGALPFTRDLSTDISIPHEVDYVSVASYSGTRTTGHVQLRMATRAPLRGREVLIVEDIVDTGTTLDWLVGHLGALGPLSLRTCCLLDKPVRRRVSAPVDYVGFPIEDRFVVGYGLDYQERFRDLPHISCLTPREVLL